MDGWMDGSVRRLGVRRGIDPVVDLFADEVDAEGHKGDAEAGSGVTELIGEHGMLSPRIPPPEELSRVFSRRVTHSLSLSLSLSLTFSLSLSMASLPFSPFILGISISLFISLFSPVHSLTCASQKLPENRTYANCTDLPTLGATLHHTYNATNRSLSVAFAAAPSKPDGWVAWGINPAAPATGRVMQGAGAFIAYKLDGKVTVDIYNLSYSGIEKAKLSFDVWDLTAEDANGEITIFASLKVPEKADSISQLWQVGPVVKGQPGKHEIVPDTYKAKAALQVVGTAEAPSESGSSGGNSTDKGNKSGGVMMMGGNFGLRFYLGLVLVVVGFMGM